MKISASNNKHDVTRKEKNEFGNDKLSASNKMGARIENKICYQAKD